MDFDTSMIGRVLGIVLAGGRGTRLGARVPKALVTLGGRTLLERACKTLDPFADELVVCAPASVELPVPEGVRVRDPEPGQGPLAGLVAAMSARRFERAVVLGVDLPLVGSEALEALAWIQLGHIAAVPAPGGRPQPLAAWYTGDALPGLRAAYERGERALVPAVLTLKPVLVRDRQLAELSGGIEAYLNINTPDDLALAERRIATEGEPR